MEPHPARLVPVLAAFLGGLLLVCVLGYAALWALDPPGASPWVLVRAPEAAAAMGGFAEVVVAVLGVAITVVAILVELAANRYTPRITDLFVRDPVNITVLGGFVVTSVLVVWLDVTAWGEGAGWMRVAAVALLSAALLALLPYFAYVFDFLTPTRVIRTLKGAAHAAVRRGRSGSAASLHAARADALHQIEQLGDMALNAVDNNDKAIAVAAVDALGDLLRDYLVDKPGLRGEWFAIDASIGRDQDFVSLHPDIVEGLAARRIFLEMKVLRQFQALFTESLHTLRDVNHLIAIQTRATAALAARRGDAAALDMVLRFLNTFLRATINARDVRTAYNLYNEVRLVAEALLAAGDEARLVELAQRMKFYGQLAFHAELPFILETAAYDLCALLEGAHAAGSPAHDRLLAVFLDVDREPDSPQQEASLRGVRKAQVKLATYYLDRGDEPAARRILDDLRGEPRARLASIRDELHAIDDPEYWEVSDRGINFDWLPPARRARLDEFFSWLDEAAAQAG
jgi:hypothetical protein